jgi:hypothetical protein
VNWAFSPNKSLQFYAQPLVSIGDYEGYKSLARPRSYEFDAYAYDPEDEVDKEFEKDFDIQSLRANAIFRWEYRPGSAFFLVWNHNRENSPMAEGHFDPSESFNELFDDSADNIFLAKVTYYFTL